MYQIHLESGTTASIAERELVRRVEAHTGRKVGNWEVKYSVFGPTSDKRTPTSANAGGGNATSNANNSNGNGTGNNNNSGSGGMINLEAISSSETDGRIVLVAGTRVVEAESSFCSVGQLRKLSNYSTLKATRTIRGVVYNFVDFIVRIGSIYTPNVVGIACEIEYLPCTVIEDCIETIHELMYRLASNLVPPPEASQETLAAKAATTNLKFTNVTVDLKKFLPNETTACGKGGTGGNSNSGKHHAQFTIRHCMLLYRKLLADSTPTDGRKE